MLTRDLERFLVYVNLEGYHTPGMHLCCWDWTGATDHKGRPRFYLDGRGMLAKRALFEILADGKLSPDSVIGTICRNDLCVRPDHLALCNDNDARSVGPRGNIGPETGQLIMNLFEDGYTAGEIAVMHQVSVPLIEAVLRESGLV